MPASRTAHNIIANYVGQGWSALMNLAFVPVYVASLGIQNYALIGIYAALQVWLALLDLGMSPTLAREMARFSGGALSATAIRDLLRSVELICASIGAAAIVAVAGAADFIATRWLQTTLPPDNVRLALNVMAVVVALRFLESLYRSALYGLERQVWFNAANVVVTTARFGGAALVVALWHASIVTFFVWHLLVSAIAVVVFRWKLLAILPAGERPARFSMAAIEEVRRFAAGMIGINLTALVLTQADKVILSRVLSLSEFGYYTLAFTMCSVIVAVTGPIVQATYPQLVRAHSAHDLAGFDAAYHRAAQLTAIDATNVAGVLCVFAPQVLRVWTGDAALTAAVAPLLAMLAAGTFLNALMQVPYFGLLAAGETRFPLRANIVAAAALIVALLLAVPTYRAFGAAATWFGVNLCFVVIGLPLLHRNHLKGLLSRWIVRDTLPAFAAVAVICLAIHAATSAVPFDRVGWLIGLGVTGGVAVACAIGVTGDMRRLALIVLARVRGRSRDMMGSSR